MKNIKSAKWIKKPSPEVNKEIVFSKNFNIPGKVSKATLEITALGVYEAKLNGERIGDYIFAPGWTSYKNRIQVQTYDVTDMLKSENELSVGVAPGWKGNDYFNSNWSSLPYLGGCELAMICALTVEFADGSEMTVYSDKTWSAAEGRNRYSHMYNGYVFDPAYIDASPEKAVEFENDFKSLIDQQGEKIIEQERLPVKEIIITPKGETVLDFGQNMTGYVEFRIKGVKGEKVTIKHGEVLDADGNFYRDNLRAAAAEASFVCDGEEHIRKPEYNFFGFRYVKLENWSDEVKKENFTAIVVHSDIKRTGYFECSDERLNRFFSNVIWGQKGNFLDVPTDCPQRDERLGWTGDAQVFAKTASYNYDVEKFFTKWLADLRADQTGWGSIPHVIPNVFNPDDECSAAWADSVTVIPWQMYLTYGNKELLEESLNSMKKYLEYIRDHMWDGIWAHGHHFGDWLNLDGSSPEDCSSGTDKDLIAQAFYIYSCRIYVKSLEVCGKNPDEYKKYLEDGINAFRNKYMTFGRIKPEYATQTACALTAYFDISDNIKEVARQLNDLVKECGHLKTGFVGTPYLLHALSDNGHIKTAYDLILREEYPSWLFSVKMGATTVWEHWDSMREDGSMWSTSMNSFNHYAYGCSADWLYGDAAGIKIDEKDPAFRHIIFAPLTDERLSYVKASIESRFGTVASYWKTENGKTEYEFTVPAGCTATVILNGNKTEIGEGTHKF